MANKQTGEVELEMRDGVVYTLRLGSWAIAELEDAVDMSMHELAVSLETGNIKMKLMICAIWAALQEHHSELDQRQAAGIIDEIGVEEIGRVIGEAFQLAFPSVEEVAEDSEGNPMKAKGGKNS